MAQCLRNSTRMGESRSWGPWWLPSYRQREREARKKKKRKKKKKKKKKNRGRA
jgi:hypothetical protein